MAALDREGPEGAHGVAESSREAGSVDTDTQTPWDKDKDVGRERRRLE